MKPNSTVYNFESLQKLFRDIFPRANLGKVQISAANSSKFDRSTVPTVAGISVDLPLHMHRMPEFVAYRSTKENCSVKYANRKQKNSATVSEDFLLTVTDSMKLGPGLH